MFTVYVITSHHATGLFLNLLKTSENQIFYNDFWGIEKKEISGMKYLLYFL